MSINKKSPIVVVEVIDDYKVVINLGSEHGISENDMFLIYSLNKYDIIDPITDDNLGKLEIVKGIGKVIHVQNKMSTLESTSYISPLEKRVIKLKSPFSFENQKEILQELQAKQLPFDNIRVLDHAKPIS